MKQKVSFYDPRRSDGGSWGRNEATYDFEMIGDCMRLMLCLGLMRHFIRMCRLLMIAFLYENMYNV